jgi:hypothetical protein
MLPYLIAGAIGYGIAKLFEEDKLSKYADGGLIAPNGKPSNLTPEQYKLVRTPAFKQWFGDWENNPSQASKVVDENGEPLVVYHGTRNRFYIFDRNKSGESNTLAKVGFWFTPKKIFAENFAENTWWGKDDSVAYATFLNIKNPKIYISEDYNGEDIIYGDSYEKFRIDIYKFAGKSPFDANIGGSGMALKNANETIDKYRELLKDEGFDGIFINQTRFDRYNAGGLNNQIVSLYPNQIKLADGSNTTFDSNNPDIRYAGGGNINDDDIRVFEELYHGTSKKRSDEIKSNGFSLRNQGEKSGLGSVNGISLTSDFDIAQEHSDWASEKFNDEGSVLTIKSETLKILSGSKFASLNSDFEKALELYKKGLIDGIELCDYETGDGCEEFEVFIFNTNKLNNLIIK